MKNEIAVLEKNTFFNQLSARLVPALQQKNNFLELTTAPEWPVHVNTNRYILTEIIEHIALSLSSLVTDSLISIHTTVKSKSDKYLEVEFRISAPNSQSIGLHTLETGSHALLKKAIRTLEDFGSSLMTILKDDNTTHTFCMIMEQAHGTGENDTPVFSGKRALIVEDNRINAFVFSSFLEEWGIRPDMATNGQEALALFDMKEYDFILMDIHMPVLNGIETTRRMKQSKKDSIIIGLTATSEKTEHDKIKEAGACDCLMKPVSSAQLLHCLQKNLNKLNSYYTE